MASGSFSERPFVPWALCQAGKDPPPGIFSYMSFWAASSEVHCGRPWRVKRTGTAGMQNYFPPCMWHNCIFRKGPSIRQVQVPTV